MIKLNDNDPMPWGMHKGRPMQDVPADYMFWVWTDGGNVGPAEKRVNECPVAEYINRNIAVFEKEHPDGIWR